MDPIEKTLPKRKLGKTGEEVSILGIGGHAIGKPRDPKTGLKIIRKAIDNGVNFLDNAWCYHGGKSEKIMGHALQDGYRDKVFLMTKNHGRDYETYMEQLDQSLKRLKKDFIDLVQFHEIIHEGEPDQIFKNGAIDAAKDAREEGKIRYIGFSGHRYPRLFKEMLAKDFQWDTVQMPINVMDYHFRSFQKQILPILKERGIAVIGMKSLGGGDGGRLLRTNAFQPGELIRYTLSQSISTLVSGIDSLEVLEKNLTTVSNFTPLSEAEQKELLDRAVPFSLEGRYEGYKTR
jgi:predicted aldo/keto reductase-like oxidoreductase